MNVERTIQELRRRILADPTDDQSQIELLLVRSHLEGPKVYMEALQDRVLWKRSPHVIQDVAIERAGTFLGTAFRHSETNVYSCGGESHRIATFVHIATGCELNLLPAGTYLMGSPSSDDKALLWERPVHSVHLDSPFLFGRTLVTRVQWSAVRRNPSKFEEPNKPVDRVSVVDCETWLSKAGDGLRLPTEAEWEYACRAGTTTHYCYGDDMEDLSKYGWHKDCSQQRTWRVASLLCNAFGLFDVHGNVWEWCQDSWSADYKNGPHDKNAVLGGSDRVTRGGSWGYSEGGCRAAYRRRSDPDDRNNYVGFRIACSLP